MMKQSQQRVKIKFTTKTYEYNVQVVGNTRKILHCYATRTIEETSLRNKNYVETIINPSGILLFPQKYIL